MDTKYFVDGNEVTPFNHKELSIELNFDKDSPDAKVLLNKWRFVNEGAELIYAKYLGGLSGGVGIFEGIPYDISINNEGKQYKYQQYLDLTTADASIACDNVECESKERGKTDWLNTVADSFSFEYLNEQTTFLPDSKFISVPYVLNSVPDYKETMIVTITMVFTIEQIRKIVSELSGLLAAGANPFASVSEFIKAAFLIIYLIALLITLINLISDLIDLIIQPIKYHKGCYVRDMIEAGCSYLGLTFNSSILKGSTFGDTFIIPKKYDSTKRTDQTPREIAIGLAGFTKPNINQTGWFEGTFGDLLREMKTIFNAKIVIINGVLTFERRDFNNSSATYIVPDIYSPAFATNASEFKSNYLIEFSVDVNDKNTIKDYKGNIVRVYTAPKIVVNKDMILTQGYQQVGIQFALARRKESLSVPEKVLDKFLKVVGVIMNAIITVVNAIIKVLNTISKFINKLIKILKAVGLNVTFSIPTIQPVQPVNFGSIISDRIGMLMIENDYLFTPKIMLLQKGATDRQTKLYANNSDIFNAKYLYDNFHFIESFVPNSNGAHNQWLRKSIDNVPFTFEDFEKVNNDNKIFTHDGKVAKIESLRWNVWKQTAQIEYRYNEIYTNNLIQSTHEAIGY
jgi:hypothetical protein